MTIRASKPAFNIREKLKELTQSIGLKGRELMRAATVQEARDLVSAGRKNLIINGDMRVAQRGTQLTNQSSVGYKTIDRMRYSQNAMGSLRFTHEQVSDAPEGFSKSLKYTVTTVEGNDPTTTEAIRPAQYRIEGQDLQHLKWGTSSAEHVTLSFWVKSSVTGRYSVQFLRGESTDRLLTRTYTINSADTWEYKTITIPGDATTTTTDDNANRLTLTWCASSGPDNKSTDSTSWGNYVTGGSHYGQEASLQNTLNATWQITGIQLEVGKNATEFEHRSYGEELALCQRYYIQYATSSDFRFAALRSNGSSTQSQIVAFPTTMRSVPGTKTVITQPTTAQLVRALDDTTSASYTTLSVNANTAHAYYVTADVALSNASQILVFNAVYAFAAEL